MTCRMHEGHPIMALLVQGTARGCMHSLSAAVLPTTGAVYAVTIRRGGGSRTTTLLQAAPVVEDDDSSSPTDWSGG